MELTPEQIDLILYAFWNLDETQNSWSRWELEKARDKGAEWFEKNSDQIEELLSQLRKNSS